MAEWLRQQTLNQEDASLSPGRVNLKKMCTLMSDSNQIIEIHLMILQMEDLDI